MSRLRMLLVIGTRPEAIKLAPVIQGCRRRGDEVELIVCLTGQHRELLDQVIDYFGIVPDLDLAVMRPGQSLAELTSRLLTGLDGAFDDYAPDCVVAQGDTTTVLAAALAAFYRRIPLIHVEAGLRTGDMQAPWPEELNRRVAGLTATIHCAPTARAAANLLAEGVPPDSVHVTGNTVIDALMWTIARERRADSPWPRKYAGWGNRRMVLITGHRRENFGDGIEAICQAIGSLADLFADVEFVYPVHPNPNVGRPVHEILRNRPNVHLIAPAPYPEFVWLMDRSTFIISDSGGVQEEAPALGRPVLVTRDSTERPEAIAAGAAELVGSDPELIFMRAKNLLSCPAAKSAAVSPFGDGRAAERIVELALKLIPAPRHVNDRKTHPRAMNGLPVC